MHIPDAYLSPSTEIVAYAVMVPLWAVGIRKTTRELSTRQAPLLSIGAAFCFAIQMFNIPAIGGTSAHALGATLLAILVGPWAALMGMTLTLVIQALLFGDGGILSLGANCWDMGFVAPFAGYGIYRLLAGSQEHHRRRTIAAAIGAYVGTVVASLSAGVLLGIQPAIAHDAVGHALYCPFGLNVAVPAMVISHLLIAGPAESVITMSALAYLWVSFPEFRRADSRPKVDSGIRLIRKFGWILILTPIGLLAGADAWGEWDLPKLAQKIGYSPQGMANSHEIVHPVLLDYGFGGLTGTTWQILGYLVSAVVGCCLVAAFARVVIRGARVVPLTELPPGAPTEKMPEWLSQKNPARVADVGHESKWLRKTIEKMRKTVEKAIASEEIARSNGFLQSVNPLAKALGFLCLLIASGIARSVWPLTAFVGLVIVLAALSRVPLKAFCSRVVETVLFFGLIVAVPLSLRSVTSGPSEFRILGVDVSSTGLHSSEMLLLRLCAGISLAMVWTLTTKWNELLQSLRAIGVPQMFLAAATLTYRYLFVVVETLAEMVEARTSRQVVSNGKSQGRTYAGRGTAILFAKSQAFTEEVHQAMVARSFDRIRRTRINSNWKAIDSIAVCLGVACLAIAVLSGVLRAI